MFHIKLTLKKRSQYVASLCLVIFVFFQTIVFAKNGFDLSNASIPENEILSGGPPRDGIPSINNPQFLKTDQAQLNNTDKVLGIIIDGEARAYPINILNWHEIVNDQVNKKNIVITYCPLCGSGVAFSSLIDDKEYNFGVSGLLYNSDVLLYDKETETLWSQLQGEAIAGKLVGTKLSVIPLVHTTWQRWKKNYPQTLVLSHKTGFNRNYQNNPYEGYEESNRLYFSVHPPAPKKYHPKELVLGIKIGNIAKAYPFIELRKNKQSKIIDEVAGEKIQIEWDEQNATALIMNSKNELLPTVQSFWFAWYAFNPKTLIYNN